MRPLNESFARRMPAFSSSSAGVLAEQRKQGLVDIAIEMPLRCTIGINASRLFDRRA
jgi:hypothetical protein